MSDVRGPYLFERGQFPITIKAMRKSNGETVWERTLLAPDSLHALRVPPLRRLYGETVDIEVRYADGTVVRAEGSP